MARSFPRRTVLAERHAILEALAAVPRSRRELRETLEGTESTVDGALADLLETGWVERVDGRYRLTSTGRLAAESYREFRATAATLESNAGLLNVLEAEATVDAAFVDGAAIEESDSADDGRLWSWSDADDEPETVYGIVPGADASIGTLVDQLERADVELAVVLEATLWDVLDDPHDDGLGRLVTDAAATVHVVPESLPYALWIHERADEVRAGITIYDESGVRGRIVNDAPPAVAWARAQYERYREAAATVDVAVA